MATGAPRKKPRRYARWPLPGKARPMSAMRKEIAIIRALFRLLAGRSWTIPLIALLGTLSSLAEGIGIGLFIPLLRHLSASTSQQESQAWVTSIINGITSALPFTDPLAALCALILASVVIKGLLTFANRALFEWVGAQLGHQLRRGIFEQLLSVGYRFLERAESGSHLNTLSSETWRVTSALSTLHALVANICTVVVFLAMLLAVSWQLTIVVLLAIFHIALCVRLLTRSARRLGREGSSANALLAKRMVEGLAGMKVIRIFSREQYEIGRFDQASERVGNVFFRIGALGAAVSPVYEILSAVLVVGLLFFHGISGLDFALLLVFILLLYRLEPRVMALDEARVSIL
ncbi:ABC transporter ATP-binding protein, partial [bacterium]